MARTLLLPLLFGCLAMTTTTTVSPFEYQVGGARGWVVPPSNDTRIYNDWASENRFLVGDTVRFRYKKDSVMEVSREEYRDCNSSRPRYFSNTGDTAYGLDRSGAYYFISGVSGHCGKGQRMIVKVLTTDHHDGGDGGNGGGNGNGTAASGAGGGVGGGGQKSAAAAALSLGGGSSAVMAVGVLLASLAAAGSMF